MPRPDRPALLARLLELIVLNAGEMFEGEVSESATFESLGMDSLDKIELVMAVETEWNIAITDEATEKLNSAGDIADLLERSLAP